VIGLFATFVVLAVAQRGGRGALLLVSPLFLILAGGGMEGTAPNTWWTAALLVSGVGALVMTGRLRQTGALVPRQETRLSRWRPAPSRDLQPPVIVSGRPARTVQKSSQSSPVTVKLRCRFQVLSSVIVNCAVRHGMVRSR